MRHSFDNYCGALSILAAVVLSACASTHTTTGKVENLAPADYGIEHLVAVAFVDDQATRQKFESGFCDRMTELGLQCDVSYQAMPALTDLDDDGALQEAKARTEADTSVLIEIVEQNEPARKAQKALFGTWVAALLLDEPALRSASAWGGLAAAGAAGNYKLRITLWNMVDDSLVWSLDTESYTFDLAKTGVSAGRLAELIYRELGVDGLI